MIYIDDTLGKQLFDMLKSIIFLLDSVEVEYIKWEKVKKDMEELIKKIERNGQ